MSFISDSFYVCDFLCYIIAASIFIIPYLFVKIRRTLWLPNISSKYIFVTGCDSGFGHALALKLDQMGCHVFAGCLTEKGETELRKLGSDKLIPMPLDVTKQETINKCLDQVKRKIPDNGGLWGIVNNAGIIGPTGRLEWIPDREYTKTLDVNLLGLVRVNNTFLPLVKKVKGRVVNLVSIYGRFSGTGIPYNVSKFAASAYADGIRRDMRMFDVTCSTIEPGFFTTPLTGKENLTKSFKDSWKSAPDSVKPEYESYYKEILERMKLETFKYNDNIMLVVDGMIHALLARYPKDRYLIGFDCNYIFRFLTMLPDWLVDFIFDRVIHRDAVPQALKMN